MTKEYAIEVIKYASALIRKNTPLKEVLDMAISALRNQAEPEEAATSGWISVKDRLPDEEQDVLIATVATETYGKHREKKKRYRDIYYGYCDGEEWLTSYCHGCEYISTVNEKFPDEVIEVTHWMPLPEFPES